MDSRADIWSLGVILFEFLAGRRPFHADTVMEVVSQILTDDPPPLGTFRPDAPPALALAVRLCLGRERERRFESVAALARALREFVPPSAQALVERIQRIGRESATRPTGTEAAAGRRSALEAVSRAAGKAPTRDGAFGASTIHGPGEELRPCAFPDVAVSVAEILPPVQ